MKKNDSVAAPTQAQASSVNPEPKSSSLTRAQPFDGDLRELPYTKPVKQERPKHPEPTLVPVIKDDPDQRSDCQRSN